MRSSRRFRRAFATIGTHLVVLVAIQVILVVTLVALAARTDFAKARSDARSHAASVARFASEFIAEEMDADATSLARLPATLKGISTAKLCAITDAEPEDTSLRWFHTDVHIVRPDGSAACVSHKGQPNVVGTSWFRAARRSSEPIVAGPLLDVVTNKLAVVQAISVGDSLVVGYSLDLRSVGPVLDNQFGRGAVPVRFTLVDKDRRAEVGSSGGGSGRAIAGTGFGQPLARTSSYLFSDLDGVQRIYAEAAVQGRGWHLYAGISTGDAFADARRALRERIVVAGVILLVVLAAAFVVQRRLARPIRALVAATERVKRGDAETAVELRGPTELIELADSFNEMVDVRTRAEAALQHAFESERRVADGLREIDGMRNAFLMAISHELRTPLTSVVGFASFLDAEWDTISPEDVRRSISSIASQSQRLERLLVDLLDVERLARGTIEPNLTETDVGALIARVVDHCGAGPTITVSVRSTTACVDAALIERVVDNLVRNALKHTPAETDVWVSLTADETDLHIVVEDAGPGIPDDLKATIFDPFVQGDVPDHAPGTGVGLNLVAQFVKLHGGRVTLTDRDGGGARFDVVIPRRLRDAPDARADDRGLPAVA